MISEPIQQVTDWPTLETTDEKLPATPEQLAYFSALLGRESNLVINACAGSSKTTTLVEGVNRLVHLGTKPQDILCLAFNKSIAETLAERMPAGVYSKTINALGHQALRGFLPKTRINKYKNSSLLKNLTPEYSELNYAERKILFDVINTAKMHAVWPSQELWEAVCETMGLKVKYPKLTRKNVNPIGAEEFLEQIFFDKADLAELQHLLPVMLEFFVCDIVQSITEGEISFTDQIYLPATLSGITLPRFPFVFVDEAQDLSRIEQVLLKMVVAVIPKGRLIAVGDRKQAIYGFKGADHKAFGRITEEWKAEVLPLSVSFRCSKAVIAEAQKLDPRIHAWEGAREGEVLHLDDWDFRQLPKGTAILCRMNYPLVGAAIEMITNGISVEFLGRDLSQDYINFVELHSKNLQSLSGLWAQLDMLLASKKPESYEAEKLEDNLKCVKAIARHYESTGISALKDHIREFFGQVGNTKLSTIHKAKGLEFEHAAILRPDLIPSPRALASGTVDDLEQEENMHYVAITRAKDKLFYLNPL